jgi:hypothetical protein
VGIPRKVLFFRPVLVAAALGLGFHLDWFRISTSCDTDTAQTGVEVDIDTNKIKTDTNTARKKFRISSEKAETPSEQE